MLRCAAQYPITAVCRLALTPSPARLITAAKPRSRKAGFLHTAHESPVFVPFAQSPLQVLSAKAFRRSGQKITRPGSGYPDTEFFDTGRGLETAEIRLRSPECRFSIEPMTKADQVIVRPLGPGDEEAFLDLRSAMTEEGTVLAKDYRAGMAWSEYLLVHKSARAGVGLAEGAVPYTFLVADLGGVLVGSSDIRHRLTEKLTRWGGHIGYIVDPHHRRRGYGTEILRQTLCLASDLGIRPALLTCRAENAGSRGVIHACGGVVSAQTHDGICSYWLCP